MQGTWTNFFLQPDALSTNKVEAHEAYLRMACRCVSDNLDNMRRFLYNMCNYELIDKMNISVKHNDGGVMVWKTLSKVHQGQKTSKMLALQATINNTKLVDFAGLNITKYHKILVPSLASAQQMNCLPLNVVQIVLKNHAGPKDVAYQSLLAQYIAEQTSMMVLRVSMWL